MSMQRGNWFDCTPTMQTIPPSRCSRRMMPRTLRVLGRVGEDRDDIVGDLDEALRQGQVALAPALAVHHLAHPERADERRVPGEDPQHALALRHLDLGARLGEAEDVVDEQQHVLALGVAEVLGDGQPRQGHPQARPGRLGLRLLQLLLAHTGAAVAAERVIAYVWGARGYDDKELLKQLVHRLRSKVESDPTDPRRLLADPGAGYRLVV
jgi:hypothetical protein